MGQLTLCSGKSRTAMTRGWRDLVSDSGPLHLHHTRTAEGRVRPLSIMRSTVSFKLYTNGLKFTQEWGMQ